MQTKKKKKGLHLSFCNFYPKAKRFYLTILLFVVLLRDICFIVRYMFFCAIFDRRIRMKTKQIRKKRIFRLPCCMEGR